MASSLAQNTHVHYKASDYTRFILHAEYTHSHSKETTVTLGRSSWQKLKSVYNDSSLGCKTSSIIIIVRYMYIIFEEEKTPFSMLCRIIGSNGRELTDS